jgi:hypothetical protein
LLLVCRAERPEGFPLSATVWRGPPPLQLGVGDVTPSLLRSTADFYCGVAAVDDLSSGREPSLLRSHWRSPLRRRLSAAACVPYSAGGMDLGRGGDVVVRSYLYVFTPDTSQLRGGHRHRPGGLATVTRQVLAPSELGLAPTANLPGPGCQTSRFFILLLPVRQRECLSIDRPKPPFCRLIAPADYSSWELRHPTVLGGIDIAVAPRGRHYRLFSSR